MIGPGIGLWLILSIARCVHVVRTNQSMYWLWLDPGDPMAGGAGLRRGDRHPCRALRRTHGPQYGRRCPRDADPTREYCQAKTACDETPTVHNRMRWAVPPRRWDGTRRPNSFSTVAKPPPASTPRTRSCAWAAPRPSWSSAATAKWLDLLQQLDLHERIRTPAATLAIGRALEGLGRIGRRRRRSASRRRSACRDWRRWGAMRPSWSATAGWTRRETC